MSCDAGDRSKGELDEWLWELEELEDKSFTFVSESNCKRAFV